MSESTSSGDERQSDLAVMDANEYKNKRRLKRVLDAQEAVEDAASDAYQLKVDGRFTDDAQNIVVLRKVQSLIREVYTLFDVDDEDNNHQKYWEKANIGAFTLPNTGENITFTGLEEVLYSKMRYQESWLEVNESRHGQTTEEIYSTEHTVPEWISWRAYLVCRQFLAEELDLDLQFEDIDDNLSVWGYEELPDDVPGTEDLIDEDDGDGNGDGDVEAGDGGGGE